MAIHVRTDYYWIEPPKVLEDRASDIVFVAALAKRLNIEHIYNQAKNAFTNLYNQWEKEGSAIAKKKSNTNWLGAGSKYLAKSMMPWEFCYNLAEAVVENMPIDECKKELQKTLSKL